MLRSHKAFTFTCNLQLEPLFSCPRALSHTTHLLHTTTHLLHTTTHRMHSHTQHTCYTQQLTACTLTHSTPATQGNSWAAHLHSTHASTYSHTTHLLRRAIAGQPTYIPPTQAHTHAHTHVRTYANTHMHTQAHTQAHIHMFVGL